MKTVRIWRYEVDEVWGSMVGRITVGDAMLDRWKADRCWHMYNFKTGVEGGWHCKLLGEAEPEMADKVRRRWADEKTRSRLIQ